MIRFCCSSAIISVCSAFSFSNLFSPTFKMLHWDSSNTFSCWRVSTFWDKSELSVIIFL